MNPHASYQLSLLALFQVILVNRRLIFSLIKSEILGRYRGSVMGILWSFFNPILMLVVYTFVFSVVFKAKWIGGSDSKTEFALILFSGLLVYNLFSECINRAPGLMIGNINYVKKVIFPLEILPIVVLGTSFFHFLISLFVWVLFYNIFFGFLSFHFFLLPFVILPLILLILGLSWFLASLGVYLRDVAQLVTILTTVLMFLSPIFFPIAAMPEKYHVFMELNPLTFIIEQTRDVLIWKKGINWSNWFFWMLISSFIAWFGFIWFQKTRKGFADVI